MCDGSAYVNGCLPQWGVESTIRVKSAIEHELTWAYYRMRRHPEHPVRKDISQQFPPTEMQGVSFWQDLRPPFVVRKVHLAKQGTEDLKNLHHPDGDLYHVTYECGLDYVGERKFDTMPGSSSFDNKVHGVAAVRFSNHFPTKRQFRFLSWGRPVCVRSPGQAGEAEAHEEREVAVVDSKIWNPLAKELGERADSDRMNRVHSEVRSMHRKSLASGPAPLEQTNEKRAIMGTHTGLQAFLKAKTQDIAKSSRQIGLDTLPHEKKIKMREHRICTSAGGFLKYHG